LPNRLRDLPTSLPIDHGKSALTGEFQSAFLNHFEALLTLQT